MSAAVCRAARAFTDAALMRLDDVRCGRARVLELAAVLDGHSAPPARGRRPRRRPIEDAIGAVLGYVDIRQESDGVVKGAFDELRAAWLVQVHRGCDEPLPMHSAPFSSSN